MTYAELVATCRRSIERHGLAHANVILTVPSTMNANRAHMGESRRMFGRGGGPIGRVVGPNRDGDRLIMDFKATEVLSWLHKKGYLDAP